MYSPEAHSGSPCIQVRMSSQRRTMGPGAHLGCISLPLRYSTCAAMIGLRFLSRRSSGSRPLLAASGVRRLVRWVHPGVPILTDTESLSISLGDGTDFPLSHVICMSLSVHVPVEVGVVSVGTSPSTSFSLSLSLSHASLPLSLVLTWMTHTSFLSCSLSAISLMASSRKRSTVLDAD